MHGGKMCKAGKPRHPSLYQQKGGQICSALEHCFTFSEQEYS